MKVMKMIPTRSNKFVDELVSVSTTSPTLQKAVGQSSASHLEYAVPVWAPLKNELTKKAEAVQRRVTKYIPGRSGLTYPERLRKRKLPTLVYRRLRGFSKKVYKS